MLTTRFMSAEQVIECIRNRNGMNMRKLNIKCWRYGVTTDLVYSWLFAFLSTDVCSTDTTQCLIIGYSLWRLHFVQLIISGWVTICMFLCSWISSIHTRLLSTSLDYIYFVQVDMGYTVFPLLNCTSVHAYLFCSFSGRNHVLITYWLFCLKDVQVTCIL